MRLIYMIAADVLRALGWEVEIKEKDSYWNIVLTNTTSSEDMPQSHKSCLRGLLRGWLMEFNYEGGRQQVNIYKELHGLDPEDDRYSCLDTCVKRTASDMPESELNDKEVFVRRKDRFDRYVLAKPVVEPHAKTFIQDEYFREVSTLNDKIRELEQLLQAEQKNSKRMEEQMKEANERHEAEMADQKENCSLTFSDFVLRIPDGFEARVEDGKVIFHRKYWEPKFKVGDWITDGQHVVKIINTDSHLNQYYFVDTDGKENSLVFSYVDKEYDLWTVEDAKNGDVLYSPKDFGVDAIILIDGFKMVDGTGNTLYSLCAYRIADNDIIIGEPIALWCEGALTKYYPATQEQKDLLFQKMDEAGYEWDAEKLELRKKKWQPKEGEDFYYTRHNGPYYFDTGEGEWTEGDHGLRYMYIKNNVFQTKEEAQALCKKLNDAIKQIFDEIKIKED